ncbi:MAG: ribonuclease P protein component [Candidatus Paceibacterota bacterium]|jgi:ribonuclease P protein component
MLARKFRLPIPEFKSQKSKLVRLPPYFSTRSRGNSIGHNRFAIVISAKLIAKSTERHYFKRRVIENLKKWPNLNSDFLFIVVAPIKNLKKFNFKTELSAILAEIKKQ